GPLDRELTVRQRLARHLHAAEAAGLEHRDQVDLGAEDFLHAADVLVAGQPVDVAVEVAAAELDAAPRLDHLVAEGAALAALADLGAGNAHGKSLESGDRMAKRVETGCQGHGGWGTLRAGAAVGTGSGAVGGAAP